MADNPSPTPPPIAPAAPAASTSATGTILLAVAALYFGRDILIPLALAILLSFILTPPMLWFRRLGLPRVAAVALVVAVACAAIGGVAVAVGAQIVQLAENLPSYQRNIRQKIDDLRNAAPGGGLVERVTGTLKDLRRELSAPQAAPPGPAGKPREPERAPVPVVIEQGPVQPLALIQTYLAPLLGPLGTAGLVVVFVIFILIEREELRDRFIKLVGGSDLQKSTQAITEAAGRVSRYLLMQLVVNVTYGIPVGIGLYLIGVPNAMLWGVLATVLRFIPYLGPWLAALLPIVIAFGVDPGWSMLLWTIALFVFLELVSNNIVEPWLYGSSTGLSSFAIILSAIVWTLLWGPVGLFLATPLTVCLVVIGRYVPRLEFLGVVLGSDPVLTPAERFYQRLLAGNVAEAVEMAEEQVDATSSLSFYADVAVPALRLAENDRQRSGDVAFRRNIADAVSAVVKEVVDHATRTAREPARMSGLGRVLCIGGQTELDQAAAEALAGRLVEIGARAQVIAPVAVSAGAIAQLELKDVALVVLCYLHRRPQAHARYVVRRLMRREPRLQVIVCCLSLEGATSEMEERIGQGIAVVTNLASVEARALQILETPSMEVQGRSLSSSARAELADLRRLGLTTGKSKLLEMVAQRVSSAFSVPIVQVALVEEPDHASAKSTVEVSTSVASVAGVVCRAVVTADTIVVVEDVAEDEHFSKNEQLLEKGIRFFAGAPLRSRSGEVLGAVCLLDSKPRELSSRDRSRLAAMADEIAQGRVTPESSRSGSSSAEAANAERT